MRTIRTAKARKIFIEKLTDGWSVSLACKAARIGRTAAYQWRADDEAFAKDWDDAYEIGSDGLEDVLHSLAVGSPEREPDMRALITELKARRPDKYRDNSTVRHQGDVGVRIIELNTNPK